jgi:hypothetical protein
MLAIAARSAGLFVKGAGDALPFLTFLGLATLTTAAVFAIGQRVEGTFRQSLQSWFIGQATLVTSGLGENLLVGPQSSLALSQTPVLELSAPVRRLRAQVMDRFDGYRWSTSESFRQVIGDIASTRIAGETPRALEVVALTRRDMGSQRCQQFAGRRGMDPSWQIRSARVGNGGRPPGTARRRAPAWGRSP